MNTRVSALGLPQLVRLLDGPEEPETALRADWWTEYGGRLDEATGKIELPMPTFAPCPYEDCPDCKLERGH
ncbi:MULTISPECIES: hypothetical protein [unclassified Streptomyces]|uniref:hypothetical protein n=1 Tax=unclassified Streptomyces TaxID=2593676 RepID=UPI001EFCF7D1|nr:MULTISPECIES: hypothetical protein [unclassified Streptomyces]